MEPSAPTGTGSQSATRTWERTMALKPAVSVAVMVKSVSPERLAGVMVSVREEPVPAMTRPVFGMSVGSSETAVMVRALTGEAPPVTVKGIGLEATAGGVTTSGNWEIEGGLMVKLRSGAQAEGE